MAKDSELALALRRFPCKIAIPLFGVGESQSHYRTIQTMESGNWTIGIGLTSSFGSNAGLRVRQSPAEK
jgi:hypothetical protein